MMSPPRVARAALLLLLLSCAGRAAAHLDHVFACFVYLEPYEVRVEFVATANALEIAQDLGFEIDADEQRALAQEMGQRLAEAFEVHADGRRLDFKTDRVEFVRSEFRGSPLTPDDREVIPVQGARLSGVFVSPHDDLPDAVEVVLTMFNDPRYRPPDAVPVEIEVLTAPTQRESTSFELTADNPRQSWTLPPTLLRAALQHPAAPPPPSYALLVAALAAAGGGLLIAVVPFWKSRGRWVLGAAVLVAGLGTGGWALQRGLATPVQDAQAESAVQALLTNVYLAFAHRDESKIFDTLAASVDGPLLEDLYLDIRRGLSDAEDGGPSVRVLGVELLDCEIQRADSARLETSVRWVSSGTVSHWGHAHERHNRYRARVVAEPVDARWKLTEVTILEEERVE